MAHARSPKLTYKGNYSMELHGDLSILYPVPSFSISLDDFWLFDCAFKPEWHISYSETGLMSTWMNCCERSN